ncbi:HSP20 family protein [Scopulibacillus daqui]|uniref:HSP20 family protein n=1 Tax=Scopulibacillus daqui TaxID=1469162 RepID=A0ABS2Q311_9BACL|nr:Hsp20/alpha crystallin family protein [Scopulibacillus daqui]MBM7646601.1 HSP20 family protein [Scopulibacillus daqui]
MDQKQKFTEWKKSVSDFLGRDFWHDFQDIFMREWPLINIYESSSTIYCLIALPGLVNQEDVRIFINHQTITLKGRVSYPVNGYQTIHEEFSNGHFERTIELPHPVYQKPIDAVYKKGLLTLILKRIQDQEVSEVVVIEDENN